jgi:hypothetical protein
VNGRIGPAWSNSKPSFTRGGFHKLKGEPEAMDELDRMLATVERRLREKP